MSGKIRVERTGCVATVVIDNPAKRNAMDQAMWTAMGDALLALEQEDDVRCVVLRGEGAEAFGSGADISEFSRLRSTKAQAIAFGRHGHRAMHAIQSSRKPTVAAIRGMCVGGGLELAIGCDIRLASDDAKFGVPIARLGGVLAYPELEGLVRVAGPQVALELLLEGRLIGAAEALAKGVISRAVPRAEFESELERTVQRIVSSAPLAARWHKKFVRRLLDATPLSDAELAEGYDCFDTEDFAEGWHAFLEKRTPSFQGK